MILAALFFTSSSYTNTGLVRMYKAAFHRMPMNFSRHVHIQVLHGYFSRLVLFLSSPGTTYSCFVCPKVTGQYSV
jgi:hypothetical protein